MKTHLKVLLTLPLLWAVPALAMSLLPSKAPAGEDTAPPATLAPAPIEAPAAPAATTAPAPAPTAPMAAAPASSPAAQGYKYAHNDAEYSVLLPEAPTVETVWADAGNVPSYLENPPKEGALGEVAAFRRADTETGESFDIRITFLRADADFLSKLSEDKIKAALENDFKDTNLSDAAFSLSSAPGSPLKWGTLTGFSIDRAGHPAYNAGHFLTGKHSIMLVKIQYSVENTAFTELYRKVADNISYITP